MTESAEGRLNVGQEHPRLRRRLKPTPPTTAGIYATVSSLASMIMEIAQRYAELDAEAYAGGSGGGSRTALQEVDPTGNEAANMSDAAEKNRQRMTTVGAHLSTMLISAEQALRVLRPSDPPPRRSVTDYAKAPSVYEWDDARAESASADAERKARREGRLPRKPRHG
jgi:hypothetical protein